MTNTTRTVSVIESEIKTAIATLALLKDELKLARKNTPDSYEQGILDYVGTHPGCARAQIAKDLCIEADQKLTQTLLALREQGRLVNKGNKRASVWFSAAPGAEPVVEEPEVENTCTALAIAV